MRRTVPLLFLVLLVISMFTLAFNVRFVRAQTTVYINADGSITPAGVPITTPDNVTYTFTGTITYPIYDGIVVDRSNIVIDGNGYTVHGNDNVSMYSWTGAGISMTDVSNVTVENVRVQNFQWGIYLNSSSNNTVAGNIETANIDGIYLWDSSNNTISHNTATIDSDGILIDLSSYNSVTDNNATANSEFGIYLSVSSNNNVTRNTMSANVYKGMYLINSSSNTIVGNNASANIQYGISLDFSSNGNTVNGNTVTADNASGISLFSSNGNTVGGNTATGDVDCGIKLDSSSNNNVSGNNVSANVYKGIWFYNSSSNTVIGNNESANSEGMSLDNFSNRNTLALNNLSFNNQYGISFLSSSKNTIYHNDFMNNTDQIYDLCSTNIWDDGYPSGGNYWSDYNGKDLYSGPYQNVTGRDGIGDSPYFIDANNTDFHPLMQPFEHPPTYVACSPDVAYAGSSVTCAATVSGSSPTGTVNWTTSSSTGYFTPSVCILSSGNCSTTYTDNNTGYVTITARYGGDSNNLQSNGSTTLTVFINVTTGTNVTVTPADNLELTFANVTTAGYIVANQTLTVDAPTMNNTVGSYYDISVVAGYSGNVTISLAFDGSNMTLEQKENLTMVQYAPIPGDVVVPFGKVDMRDIGFIARQFGTTPTSSNWDPRADITGLQYLVPDGKVDMRDVGLAARHFLDTSAWTNITAYVDTTNNIIYGNTTHFSFIAIH